MSAEIFESNASEVIETSSQSTALEKTLGRRQLLSLGVGGIIGTGIFVMIGLAAHDLAGPAIMVSFVIAAVACIAVALCYAEFAAHVPKAGSVYAYAYATLGEFPAWAIGWNLLLSYGIAAASVAQGWSHYFQSFLSVFNIRLPNFLSNPPLYVNSTGGVVASGCVIDLPAFLIVASLSAILILGVKTSLRFNFAMLVLKLSVIAFVIIVGCFYIHPQNWQPFAPHGWGAMPHPGGPPRGMLAGSAIMFFAYLGFENLAVYGEEAKRPQRDLPFCIVLSVVICMILYIAVAGVLTGMTPTQSISVQAPLSEAFRQAGLPWAQFLISAGAITGITSVLLLILMGLSRILLSISRDGLLPATLFNAFHPRFRTPWRGMIVTGTLVALFASLLPLKLLSDLVTMSTLLGFVVVCGALFVLRRSCKLKEAAFRAPFGAVAPIIGILTSLLLIFNLPLINLACLALWLALGIAVYRLYGRSRSVARNSHPR